MARRKIVSDTKRRDGTPYSPNVVELLKRTPKKFAGVRRHIVNHGTLPKGCRTAVLAGQFGADLAPVLERYVS